MSKKKKEMALPRSRCVRGFMTLDVETSFNQRFGSFFCFVFRAPRAPFFFLAPSSVRGFLEQRSGKEGMPPENFKKYPFRLFFIWSNTIVM